MGQKIERDWQRFRKLVRGAIKSDLRKYITQGELIGRQGKDFVSIPLPQIHIPHFRYGNKGAGGVGQGEGNPGEVVAKDPGEGEHGQAGNLPSPHIIEVEVPLAELAAILGEELALPHLLPKGQQQLSAIKEKYSGIRNAGPESLRHFKRTFKRALKRQIASRLYDPNAPLVVPVRQDKQFRSWREVRMPQSRAAIFFLMDVSGSMADRQKEIVRIETFWIDTWIRSHYQGVEKVYIIHDAEAKEVNEETFYHTRESGGTKISSALDLTHSFVKKRFPPQDWNLYAFHFTDGDNWPDDNNHCLDLLNHQLLPVLNLFGYTQVESDMENSGYLTLMQKLTQGNNNLRVTRVKNREGILDSIKVLLGKPQGSNKPC